MYKKSGISSLIPAVLLCFSCSVFAQLPFEATSVDELNTFLGHTDCKVIFSVPGNGLHYIDFSETTSGSPQVRKMQHVPDDAILPIISPDGHWITYLTETSGEDLSSGNPKAWLCAFDQDATPMQVADHARTPRFAYNTDNPTIVYSTWEGTRSGDWQYSGTTVKKEYVDGSFSDEMMLWDEGAFIGGLSYNHQWLCVAPWGPHVYMVNIETATDDSDVITLFDFDWASQTCNGSISPNSESNDEMIFLDFGSSGQNPYGTWEFHDMVFHINSANEILGNYHIPENKYPAVSMNEIVDGVENGIEDTEWDKVEYTNNPAYAVAGIKVERIWSTTLPPDRTDNTEDLYLINMDDSTYHMVVEKTSDTTKTSNISIRYSHAWVAPPTDVMRPSLRHDAAASAQVEISDNILHAPQPLARIAIYTTGGRLIAEKNLTSPRSRLTLPSVAARGMYIIHVRAHNGTAFTVAHVVQ